MSPDPRVAFGTPQEAGMAVHEILDAILAGDFCSRCDRPSDDLLERAHGERICGACRELERRRYRLATSGCGDCDYELRFHNPDGSCPSEAEARQRSGSQ